MSSFSTLPWDLVWCYCLVLFASFYVRICRCTLSPAWSACRRVWDESRMGNDMMVADDLTLYHFSPKQGTPSWTRSDICNFANTVASYRYKYMRKKNGGTSTVYLNNPSQVGSSSSTWYLAQVPVPGTWYMNLPVHVPVPYLYPVPVPVSTSGLTTEAMDANG